MKVKKKTTQKLHTFKINVTTDTWEQNGFIQGNSYVEKMLDVIVKIAKRKGPKYFESALTLTTSVAAGLSL